MTRRLFLDFIPWLVRPRAKLIADRGNDLVDVANAFAAAYRDWVVLKQQELVEGTVSVDALRAWEVVRRRWRELDGMVRNG